MSKTIYVTPVTFECHTAQNAGNTLIPYETDFFDGKCAVFVEGHICVPKGHVLVRPDGEFHGEIFTPFKPYHELEAAQREYEKQLLAEYEAELSESVRLSDMDAAYQEGVNSAYDDQ